MMRKALIGIAGAAAFVALISAVPKAVYAGQVFLLSSEVPCDSECSTTSPETTPFEFYSKTLTVPTVGTGSAGHFLQIDLDATADVHSGAGLEIGCTVDGVACDQPSSFRVYQKAQSTEDEHDNNVNVSYCAAVTPGTHTVALQMASSDGTNSVFMEAAKVNISVARLSQGNCVVGGAPL